MIFAFEEKPDALLVRIQIPGLDLARNNPGWLVNVFAGAVLGDLIALELAAANLLRERPQSGLQPFIGWFLFAVADVHRAGRVVQTVLKRNGLDMWATVFRYDETELVWRSIYPHSIVMLTEDVTAETSALAAKLSEVVALWKDLWTKANPGESDAIVEQ
jgi:hypothetical protein